MNNLNKHKEKEISCFDEINVSKDLKVEKTFYQQKDVIIKRGTRGVVVIYGLVASINMPKLSFLIGKSWGWLVQH